MSASLRRTPLHARHRELGARLVEFAGFEMPVQYTSILVEHAAVRERAGLFDVSHMGQLHLSGPGAVACAERLVTCPVASLAPGRVRYGLLCNEGGGVVDDVTVYRLDEQSLFLCVNAANIDKDREWVLAHLGPDTALEDRSEATGLLALQGPASADILADLAGPAVHGIRRFRFADVDLAGVRVLASRTGYTGSDGFELYFDADRAESVFEALLSKGDSRGLVPAGLGARDTLRLEAALPLYGHELDDQRSPLDAGLGRFVKREQGGFLGAEAIEERAARESEEVLVGFEVTGRGVARADHPVLHRSGRVGVVTSGAPSPSLGHPIGLAYLRTGLESPGTEIEISIRDRPVAARVCQTPFVTKAGS